MTAPHSVGKDRSNPIKPNHPLPDPVVTISVGAVDYCGLLADGTAVCHESVYAPRGGSLDMVQGEKFVSISNGLLHTCALREDGTAVCWGNNGRGQASPPTDVKLRSISSGGSHTCGIGEDGVVICWGSDEFGQVSPPQREKFAAISSGMEHTCGVRRDSSVSCWGNNDYGQGLMGELFVDQTLPSPGEERFVAILANGSYACGLRDSGTTTCWGDVPADEAPQPPANARFSAVSVGYQHGCGLRPDGRPLCWQVPDKYWHPLRPIFQAMTALLIYVVEVGLTETTIEKSEWDALKREAGIIERRVTQISNGAYHTCGILTDGKPSCCGSLSGEQHSGQASPPQEDALSYVSSGGFHTCALRTDGSPVC